MYGAARLNGYFLRPWFVMGNFLCGEQEAQPSRGSHCCAHSGVGSETSEEQMSSQVMAASSTRPEECYADYPSPSNYPMQDLHEILCAGSTVDDSEEHAQ
jgi:hypothetical protein